MLRLEPALDLTGPEHLADVHWLGKTVEPVPPKIAVIEERPYEAMRHWRNDERIGLGNRLQTCHQVRGLPDGSVLLGDALPHQIANNNHAGAYGDASLHHHICS